MDDSAIEE